MSPDLKKFWLLKIFRKVDDLVDEIRECRHYVRYPEITGTPQELADLDQSTELIEQIWELIQKYDYDPRKK